MLDIQIHLMLMTYYFMGIIFALNFSYFERFDDELEQISIKAGMKGRKPGQHASRQDVIKSTLEREKQEYDTCGLGRL